MTPRWYCPACIALTLRRHEVGNVISDRTNAGAFIPAGCRRDLHPAWTLLGTAAERYLRPMRIKRKGTLYHWVSLWRTETNRLNPLTREGERTDASAEDHATRDPKV